MSRLLVQVGEALYGSRWQTDLAEAIGVSDRTIRRWVAGDQRPPAGVWLDLLRMSQERAMLLDALADELKLAAAPQPDEP